MYDTIKFSWAAVLYTWFSEGNNEKFLLHSTSSSVVLTTDDKVYNWKCTVSW